ncbi:MAG: hypothetical protein ACJ71T_03470 [Actinomycetales bacterium]
MNQAPRRTAVVIGLVLLAGCTSGGTNRHATTPRTSAVTATPGPTPSPTGLTLPAGGIPGKLISSAHSAQSPLLALGALPYAIGRTLYVGGRSATVPRTWRVHDLYRAGDGIVALGRNTNGRRGCATWFLGPTGPLVQLAGTCAGETVNAEGTMVAGLFLPSLSGQPQYGIWTLPSGRLTTLSPPLVGGAGNQAFAFDGHDVLLEGSGSGKQVRWTPSTGAFVMEPSSMRPKGPWADERANQEWALVLSPDHSLGVLWSMGGSFVGVRRVSDGKYLLTERIAPTISQISQAQWTDARTLLLVVNSGNGSRLETLHVDTGRLVRLGLTPHELQLPRHPSS